MKEKINNMNNTRQGAKLYIQKLKALEHLADEIAPVVTEYIQETIAWQTDGNEYAESLTANEYLEFVNELRTKIINQL